MKDRSNLLKVSDKVSDVIVQSGQDLTMTTASELKSKEKETSLTEEGRASPYF
jgi:hypothetical protein